MSTINIAGVCKAKILAALHNASKSQGLGVLHDTGKQLSEEAAQFLLDQKANNVQPLAFDYLRGRVLKVDLTSDDLDPRLYDRDNGEGAAMRALQHLLN